ncbi:helix-turn-helix transcriptional regulator [Caloranaerobacter azorensis]|uniref:Helix-turn-helix transcriptional regulator n=1 Tax=Caloranaerobacter azorensis TaxID=116090 RepID=A0A6P1YBH9_9FIRM|nr:helix-turn-helix transcriptional regulator [Caloranaerobacter azorensis]QIB26063.1 helix-turn-helix transcriptional regulator [Caloranaerobacter azorensis]
MFEWLREKRLSRNMTQEQLAKEVGISRTMITELENGNAKPSVKTAKAIAKVLDFSWTLFFDKEE